MRLGPMALAWRRSGDEADADGSRVRWHRRGGWHAGSDEAVHPRSTRPSGHVGFVGVLHDGEFPGEEFFSLHVHLPAPVRRFLPELIDLIWSRKFNPSKVFDLTLPL